MLVNEVYEGDCLDVMREFPDNCKSTIELNKVYLGDCLKVLKSFPDNFVSTILTDPPYDLTGKSGNGGFMGKKWDSSGIAFNPEVWREALRIAKPGATLMAFGGDRTHHRLMIAIEDAGWEIRTCIYWIFGSGFPKSLSVRKSLERQFSADALCACDRNSKRTTQDSQSDYPECRHSDDEQLLLDQDNAPNVFPSQADVPACNRSDHNGDDPYLEQANIFFDEANDHPSNENSFLRTMASHNYQSSDNTHSCTSLNKSPALWTETHKMESHKSDTLDLERDLASFSTLDTPFNRSLGYTPDKNIPQCDRCGKLRTDVWEGYGTGLKPAAEIIVVAQKNPDGTFAANAEKWGLSGLWIDGARVETGDNLNGGAYSENYKSGPMPGDERTGASLGMFQPGAKPKNDFAQPKGRFPANVIHDGSEEVMAEFDKAGVRTTGGPGITQKNDYSNSMNTGSHRTRETIGYSDSGSAARFFAQCPPDPTAHPEAARFRYCPKAGKRERGNGNNHPTVKPLSLLRYLAKLTRPPDGGIVLDPFGGSGTTALAAIAEGRDYIIIEKESEYVDLCRRRIAEYSGTEIAPVEVKVESDVVKQMSLW